jgi:hypothetical protein
MNTKAVIYIKDAQKITGKSYPTCQRQIAKIRAELGLNKGEFLTLSAYCTATKISLDDAYTAINSKNKA